MLIDSTYYKLGLNWKEDFNEGRFQMFRSRACFRKNVFLRYINQCTTCRRFCRFSFNAVTKNMYVAGGKVRLCDSVFCYAFYVKVYVKAKE